MPKQNLHHRFFSLLSKLILISLSGFILHISGVNSFGIAVFIVFFALFPIQVHIASLVIMLLTLQCCISLLFLAKFPIYGVLLWVWAIFMAGIIFYIKTPLSFEKEKLPKLLRDCFGKHWRHACLAGCFLLVLPVLLRGFNLYRTGFYALMLFYLAEILRHYGTVQSYSFSLRKWLTNTCLLLASVSICFLFLECAGRFFLHISPQGEGVYMPQARYLFGLQPNSKGINRIAISPTDRIDIEYAISSQGIRDREYPPKRIDEFRILMLGDSYTMGHAVALKDSIPKQLETLLAKQTHGKQISVINCGIGGGGPLQELGLLRNCGLRLKPDLIILQVFLGNDLDNVLEEEGKALRAYDPTWKKILENYQYQNQTPMRWENWIYKHLSLYYYLRNTTKKCWVVKLIARLRFFTYKFPAPLPPSEERFPYIEANLTHWYPELEYAMEKLKKYILTMKQEAAAQNADFMVYSIPDFNELDDMLWQEQTRNMNIYGGYERWKGERVLRNFLNENGIPYIPVRDELHKINNVQKLYYIYDGHLNIKGNNIVATLIEEYLNHFYFNKHALFASIH